MRRIKLFSIFFVMALVLLQGLAVKAAAAAGGWRRADTPRIWHFPRDNGAHDAYKTEWWYFTGNLNDDEGGRYGFELTFFREGESLRPQDSANPWSLRDLYFAHFAITDVSGKRFVMDERASRSWARPCRRLRRSSPCVAPRLASAGRRGSPVPGSRKRCSPTHSRP